MQDHLSIFTNDPDFVELLREQSMSLSFDEDRIIFMQGEVPDGLHILHEGVVSLSSICAENMFVIYRQASSPALLGLAGVLGNEPHAFTGIARKGARLSFIDRKSLGTLIESSPLFSLKVVQLFATEVDAARRAVLDQLRRPAPNASSDEHVDSGTLLGDSAREA